MTFDEFGLKGKFLSVDNGPPQAPLDDLPKWPDICRIETYTAKLELICFNPAQSAAGLDSTDAVKYYSQNKFSFSIF